MVNPLQLHAFRALANHRRLQILAQLNRQGATSLTDLSRDIRLSVKSTHKHLAQLAQAGFVASERLGLTAYYRLEPQHNLARLLLQILRR